MRYRRIYLEITTKCNKNCAFCGGTTRPSEEISVSDFEKRLKQIKNLADRIYLYVAGEPLLHSKLADLLALAEKECAEIGISTNGTLILEQIDALMSPSLHELSISLHAVEQNTAELEEIIAATLTLYDKRGKNLLINFRIWNGSDAKDIAAILYSIFREKFGGNIYLNHNFDSAHKHKIAENIFVHFDFAFSWGKNAPERASGFCYGLQNHFAILSDGSVSPCCICKDGEIVLGNINNTSIDKILSSARAKRIAGGFTKRVLTEEICRKCEFIRQKFN